MHIRCDSIIHWAAVFSAWLMLLFELRRSRMVSEVVHSLIVTSFVVVNNWTWQWHTLVSISIEIERGDALSRRSSNIATNVCFSQNVSQIWFGAQLNPFSIKTDGFLIVPHFNTVPHFQFNSIQRASIATRVLFFNFITCFDNWTIFKCQPIIRNEQKRHRTRFVCACVFFSFSLSFLFVLCFELYFRTITISAIKSDEIILQQLKYILIWWFVLIAGVWGANNVQKKETQRHTPHELWALVFAYFVICDVQK